MTKDKVGYPTRQQPRSGTGIWHSEELVFGLTRGASVPARRRSGGAERRSIDPTRSFEETYPSYPFSELVRLAIGFGRWLARTEKTGGQSSAHCSGHSQGGVRNHLRHFSGPASPSQR